MGLICILEYIVICELLLSRENTVALTVLAVSPVVSVTFITIAVLFSIFSRNQNKEISSIPLNQVTKLFGAIHNGS